MRPEQGGLLTKAEDSLAAAKLMQENGYHTPNPTNRDSPPQRQPS
jgi:hypothetical protein